jgi:hypothetical protein
MNPYLPRSLGSFWRFCRKSDCGLRSYKSPPAHNPPWRAGLCGCNFIRLTNNDAWRTEESLVSCESEISDISSSWNIRLTRSGGPRGNIYRMQMGRFSVFQWRRRYRCHCGATPYSMFPFLPPRLPLFCRRSLFTPGDDPV